MTQYMRDLENMLEGEIKATVEDAVEYGISKEKTIARLRKKYDLTEIEAMEKYEQYAATLV